MATTDALAALTRERLRALHRDGFVLLPAVLNTTQITGLRHEIDHLRPAA